VLAELEGCPKEFPLDLGSNELEELLKPVEEIPLLTSIKVLQNNKSALFTLKNFITLEFLKYNSNIISSLVFYPIN